MNYRYHLINTSDGFYCYLHFKLSYRWLGMYDTWKEEDPVLELKNITDTRPRGLRSTTWSNFFVRITYPLSVSIGHFRKMKSVTKIINFNVILSFLRKKYFLNVFRTYKKVVDVTHHFYNPPPPLLESYVQKRYKNFSLG
jgi:hypothetical protein